MPRQALVLRHTATTVREAVEAGYIGNPLLNVEMG